MENARSCTIFCLISTHYTVQFGENVDPGRFLISVLVCADQMKEVHNYGLDCTTVGSGNTLHLRIFPHGDDKKSNDAVKGALA